jgi:hypothetical protein
LRQQNPDLASIDQQDEDKNVIWRQKCGELQEKLRKKQDSLLDIQNEKEQQFKDFT